MASEWVENWTPQPDLESMVGGVGPGARRSSTRRPCRLRSARTSPASNRLFRLPPSGCLPPDCLSAQVRSDMEEFNIYSWPDFESDLIGEDALEERRGRSARVRALGRASFADATLPRSHRLATIRGAGQPRALCWRRVLPQDAVVIRSTIVDSITNICAVHWWERTLTRMGLAARRQRYPAHAAAYSPRQPHQPSTPSPPSPSPRLARLPPSPPQVRLRARGPARRAAAAH